MFTHDIKIQNCSTQFTVWFYPTKKVVDPKTNNLSICVKIRLLDLIWIFCSFVVKLFLPVQPVEQSDEPQYNTRIVKDVSDVVIEPCTVQNISKCIKEIIHNLNFIETKKVIFLKRIDSNSVFFCKNIFFSKRLKLG